MSERNTLAKIKAVLGMDLKLEQLPLDNGAILEAEVFEAGQEVFIVTDDEKIALPVGEYKMEDGRILVIAEEGIIAEIKEEVAVHQWPVILRKKLLQPEPVQSLRRYSSRS